MRSHPLYGLYRPLPARLVPGRLKRHKGLEILLRVARGTVRLRRQRQLPHAGRDRFFERAGYGDRPGEERRSSRRAAQRSRFAGGAQCRLPTMMATKYDDDYGA